MPDKDKLLKAIDAMETTAYGSDSDGSLESDRAAAIDAYLGKNSRPAPDGRSQVVDRSVYETIQWILPSLCRVFANGDDVIEIPPQGPEDEQAAKQEGHYLNYLLTQKNQWFEVFRTAAHDALMTKAGYLYCFKDKRRFVELERYERQTPQSLALLFQDKNLRVVSSTEYVDETAEPQMDPMTGMPVPQMLYDVEVRRVREENAFRVTALPPERCKIAEETPAWHLVDCPYFEYYENVTLSDLRAEGYDVPDDISDGSQDDDEEATSRNQFGELTDDEGNSIDPAMRRVRKRMIWIRYDYDEDGIAELQYVLRVGREILERQECNRIPVAVLACDPMPHRHVGLSVADTVGDLQDIKTAILRQGLDNLYQSNNVRTFADPTKVNIDDLLINRPGGVVRTKGAIMGQDFGPIPTPFMFDKAMAGLEYMDQVRENRAGINRYFTGIDQNAMNKTATGIQQLSSMAAQRVEQIARTFALGIEQLGAILHEIVLKSGHKKETIRLRGNWIEVDPAAWKNRYDFRISVAYSAGNKDAQLNRLQIVGQYQAQAMQGGVPIVTPQNLYETAVELTKAADLSTPERFWTEPSKIPPAGPPQPDPTIMAAEQLKAQSALQTKQIDVEQKERDSVRDYEVKKYQIETDAQVKLVLAGAQKDTALEVEKARGEANPKTVDAKSKAKESEAMLGMLAEVMKANNEQTMQIGQMITEAFNNLRASMSAPKQIVRDKSGRAVGVETVQ